MSLESIKDAIVNFGADWNAEETPLSQLKPAERKKMMGLNIDDAELATFASQISAANFAHFGVSFGAPASINWRNKDGVDWTTNVKNQGTCNACVAFSVCAMMETRARILRNDANLSVNLSENQLFFCGCGKCRNSGWTFAPALNFARDTGVAAETSSTYTVEDKTCPSAPAVMKVTSWRQISSIAERKNAIANNGPIIGGMKIFADFFNYKGGVYRHVSGSHTGNHAITIIGYDNSGWICKNSWNTTWGEQGFFRVAYGDECGLDTMFPSFEANVAFVNETGGGGGGVDQSDCASFAPALQSVLDSTQFNPALHAALRFHICGRGTPPVMSATHSTVVDHVRTILAHCPGYRSAICDILG
jgi:C1A family cysteine protease